MSRTNAAVGRVVLQLVQAGLPLLIFLFCCWLVSRLLLLLVSRTTAPVIGEQDDCCCCGCAAAGTSRIAAVDYLLRVVQPPALSLFQLCAMSGRCATCPSSAIDAATRGGASSAASATRSNRVPSSGGGRSAKGHASAGLSQGSRVPSVAPGSLTQERENETETEIGQRLAAQE